VSIDAVKEILALNSAMMNALRIKLRDKLTSETFDLSSLEVSEIIETVVETMFEGVGIQIQPATCTVQLSQFSLHALNSRGGIATPEDVDPKDGILTTDNFIVISPIPEAMIKTVEFPIFDYTERTPIEINVTVFPGPIKIPFFDKGSE
jgi:hypothetical protein